MFLTCHQGGTYLVFLFDNFAAQYAILTAVFFEAIAVSWFYGKLNIFCLHIGVLLLKFLTIDLLKV